MTLKINHLHSSDGTVNGHIARQAPQFAALGFAPRANPCEADG